MVKERTVPFGPCIKRLKNRVVVVVSLVKALKVLLWSVGAFFACLKKAYGILSAFTSVGMLFSLCSLYAIHVPEINKEIAKPKPLIH